MPTKSWLRISRIRTESWKSANSSWPVPWSNTSPFTRHTESRLRIWSCCMPSSCSSKRTNIKNELSKVLFSKFLPFSLQYRVVKRHQSVVLCSHTHFLLVQSLRSNQFSFFHQLVVQIVYKLKWIGLFFLLFYVYNVDVLSFDGEQHRVYLFVRTHVLLNRLRMVRLAIDNLWFVHLRYCLARLDTIGHVNLNYLTMLCLLQVLLVFIVQVGGYLSGYLLCLDKIVIDALRFRKVGCHVLAQPVLFLVFWLVMIPVRRNVQGDIYVWLALEIIDKLFASRISCIVTPPRRRGRAAKCRNLGSRWWYGFWRMGLPCTIGRHSSQTSFSFLLEFS